MSDWHLWHTLSVKRRDNNFSFLCFYWGSSWSHPSLKWANSIRILWPLCYINEEIVLAWLSFHILAADIWWKFSYCVNSIPQFGESCGPSQCVTLISAPEKVGLYCSRTWATHLFTALPKEIKLIQNQRRWRTWFRDSKGGCHLT